MKTENFVIYFDLFPDENLGIEDYELYYWRGKKPTLKDKYLLAEKLGFDSIISDIEEFPEDRAKILNEYIKVIKLTNASSYCSRCKA